MSMSEQPGKRRSPVLFNMFQLASYIRDSMACSTVWQWIAGRVTWLPLVKHTRLLAVIGRDWLGFDGGGAVMKRLCKTLLFFRRRNLKQNLWFSNWSLTGKHFFFLVQFFSSLFHPWYPHRSSFPPSSFCLFIIFLAFLPLSLFLTSLCKILLCLSLTVCCFFFLHLCWPSIAVSSLFRLPSSHSHTHASLLEFLPLCLSDVFSYFDPTPFLTAAVTPRTVKIQYPTVLVISFSRSAEEVSTRLHACEKWTQSVYGNISRGRPAWILLTLIFLLVIASIWWTLEI